MGFDEFKKSIAEGHVPDDFKGSMLEALWWDANGDWDKAHIIAQDDGSSNGAWVHAYLHRKEGDLGNADYWYRNARKAMPTYSLEDEWLQLVKYFLKEKN